jgi:AcrR family transcriptional regulator
MTDNRRDAIADAAIEIIATEGLRALTHRAIDTKLGYPTGSTSYYLRTRHALLEAVVNRLSTRTAIDLGPNTEPPTPGSLDDAARMLGHLLVSMADSRPLDHLARFALRIDLLDEPDLHALVSDRSPIRQELLAAATALLETLGIDEPEAHAIDLVALADGLLFDRLTNREATADPARLLRAYLTGLPRR